MAPWLINICLIVRLFRIMCIYANAFFYTDTSRRLKTATDSPSKVRRPRDRSVSASVTAQDNYGISTSSITGRSSLTSGDIRPNAPNLKFRFQGK